MRNISRVILVLVLLLLVTSIATAGGPVLESFSTTGYSLQDFDEFEYLGDNRYAKLKITAEGEYAETTNACEIAVGEKCGVYEDFYDDSDDAFGGSFDFEEWVIADLYAGYGINNGNMNVSTASGEAEIRFSGLADGSGVQGSFKVLKGKDAYKGKGEGTYSGNAGSAFTVDYEFCGGKFETTCAVDRCAAFGDEKLKVKKDKIEWKIENEGESTLTVQTITVFWPAANGQLEKVKLGGKTIDDKAWGAAWAEITVPSLDWGGEVKDLQIDSGNQAKLTFEFEQKYDDAVPSDYTILVQFVEGCAVTFVAFPEE